MGTITETQPHQASLCGGIDFANLPHRDLNHDVGPRASSFQLVIRQSALNQIYRKCSESPTQNASGVLVGNVYRDRTGPYLYIQMIIPGQRKSAEVATDGGFTSQAWDEIQTSMEIDFPSHRVVGWYQARHDQGATLGLTDQRMHESCFGLPWQVAYVFDPGTGEEAMHAWKHGGVSAAAHLIEHDEPSTKPVPVLPVRKVVAPTTTSFRQRLLRNPLLLASLGLLGLIITGLWVAMLMTNNSGQ